MVHEWSIVIYPAHQRWKFFTKSWNVFQMLPNHMYDSPTRISYFWSKVFTDSHFPQKVCGLLLPQAKQMLRRKFMFLSFLWRVCTIPECVEFCATPYSHSYPHQDFTDRPVPAPRFKVTRTRTRTRNQDFSDRPVSAPVPVPKFPDWAVPALVPVVDDTPILAFFLSSTRLPYVG